MGRSRCGRCAPGRSAPCASRPCRASSSALLARVPWPQRLSIYRQLELAGSRTAALGEILADRPGRRSSPRTDRRTAGRDRTPRSHANRRGGPADRADQPGRRTLNCATTAQQCRSRASTAPGGQDAVAASAFVAGQRLDQHSFQSSQPRSAYRAASYSLLPERIGVEVGTPNAQVSRGARDDVDRAGWLDHDHVGRSSRCRSLLRAALRFELA